MFEFINTLTISKSEIWLNNRHCKALISVIWFHYSCWNYLAQILIIYFEKETNRNLKLRKFHNSFEFIEKKFPQPFKLQKTQDIISYLYNLSLHNCAHYHLRVSIIWEQVFINEFILFISKIKNRNAFFGIACQNSTVT